MPEAKPTPGPWTIDWRPGSPYAANGGSYIAFILGNGTNVADICNSAGMTDEEAAANARLIAAARETAAERDRLIKVTTDLMEMLEVIRCNTEDNTFGGFCDLPDESAPHTREQHLESQLRAINQCVRGMMARAKEA